LNQMSVKYRNMLIQVLLMIVTFGFYAIYWFYVTSKEMKGLTNSADAAPGLWTVLLFVPLANLYAYYKHSELFQKVSSENIPKWVLFLLWIFFSPGVWFLVQMELNQRARG